MAKIPSRTDATREGEFGIKFNGRMGRDLHGGGQKVAGNGKRSERKGPTNATNNVVRLSATKKCISGYVNVANCDEDLD